MPFARKFWEVVSTSECYFTILYLNVDWWGHLNPTSCNRNNLYLLHLVAEYQMTALKCSKVGHVTKEFHFTSKILCQRISTKSQYLYSICLKINTNHYDLYSTKSSSIICQTTCQGITYTPITIKAEANPQGRQLPH